MTAMSDRRYLQPTAMDRAFNAVLAFVMRMGVSVYGVARAGGSRTEERRLAGAFTSPLLSVRGEGLRQGPGPWH